MTYRSSDMTNKVAVYTRLNLTVDDEREMRQMASDERRSLAHMVSVLVEEAIVQRKAKRTS